jgi:hypothetical protein
MATSDDSFRQLPLNLETKKMSQGDPIDAFYLNGVCSEQGLADDFISCLPRPFLLRNICFALDWAYLPQEII